MTIENTPKIADDQHVTDMRSALEHRATWWTSRSYRTKN